MEHSAELSPIIIGCGYLGRTLSRILIDQYQSVPIGVVKSRENLDRLSSLGVISKKYDLDKPNEELINCEGCDVYYFAPPGSIDDKDHRIKHFLEHCQSRVPRRVVYISTSGVYGDCGGAWVDEFKSPAPITTRAKRRLDAEQTLVRFCQQFNCEYMILRVGGIYGGERLPINRLKETKVICPQEAPFSNRIHIDDLAKICYVAMHSKVKNEIFNVADGHPSSMTDYFYQIADLSGLPRPECVPMSEAREKLSPGMFSFVNESRRLSIEKMKSLLKVTLQFPTLKSGLEDCFKKLHAK